MTSALTALFALSACTSQPASKAPDFQTAVEHHLETVETRDFEGFRDTLTRTDDLYVIFPGGTALESTAEVLDFHKNWFEDREWVFDTEVEKVIEGTTQSTALVKYSFKDTADGPPRFAWLVLTFQLENNEWRLIHDQNTRIEE
ncbi:MAG: nuclear transport factor 2 family protein [Marinomonas sp.]